MLKVVHDGSESNAHASTGASGSLLDEIVRDGARKMLAAALHAEVAAYIDQFADQVDENGRRLVVRNGYHHERDVLTAAGAVTVTAPRVNDKRIDADTRAAATVFVGTCMDSLPATSVPRWSSSPARGRGCRRPRSPG
jgi:putative transposase